MTTFCTVLLLAVVSLLIAGNTAFAVEPAAATVEPGPPAPDGAAFIRNLTRWLDLSTEQQDTLGRLYDVWRKAPPERREIWRARIRRFRNLPIEEQARIRDRWRTFFQLTPDQREKLDRFRQEWEKIPLERRLWLMDRIRQLAPEKRSEMWDSLSQLRELPLEERRVRARETLRQFFGGTEEHQQPQESPQ